MNRESITFLGRLTQTHTPDLHREMPGQASKELLQARTDCMKKHPRGGAIGVHTHTHTHTCTTHNGGPPNQAV